MTHNPEHVPRHVKRDLVTRLPVMVTGNPNYQPKHLAADEDPNAWVWL